eukprot:755150-Hanusia_phi.AAC.1
MVHPRFVVTRKVKQNFEQKSHHDKAATATGVVPGGTFDHDDEETDHPFVRRRSSVLAQLKEGIFTNNPRFWETLTYIIFLMIFTWVCMNAQGGSKSYSLAQSVRNSFSSFESISSPGGWFDFMQTVFVPAVLPVSWYNNDPLTASDLRQVNMQFLLLGTVSARQVRVKPNTCNVIKGSKMSVYADICYGPYSSSNEDRTPYGPTYATDVNMQKFNYQTALELGCKVGCSTRGVLNSYSGGGYKGETGRTRQLTKRGRGLCFLLTCLSQRTFLHRET